MLVVAVDWSGRRREADQRRHIWLAEAVGGRATLLESGRTRAEVVAHLVDRAAAEARLVAGLDFAFSLPAWYLEERRLSPSALWRSLSAEALTPRMRQLGLAAWIEDPDPPFWGRGRSPDRARAFRQTERDLDAPRIRPKSVFQLVGAGQVGRSSLYGMQALHELEGAGFAVWPFDAARMPLVVEIYPRLLIGPAVTSSLRDRAAFLEQFDLAPDLRAAATSSVDAFDALVSAIRMSQHADELASLEPDARHATEGRIWAPATTRPGAGGGAAARRDGSVESLVDRYLEAWSEAEPARRLSLLRDVLAAGGSYVDPLVPEPLVGPSALSAHIEATRARTPPFLLERTGPVDHHHEHVRFAWVLRLRSGEIDNAGVDVVALDSAGRMERIVGFFDPPR